MRLLLCGYERGKKIIFSFAILIFFTGVVTVRAGELTTDRAFVAKVIDYVREIENETIEEQIKISEIPAPPFGEEARAAYIRQRFVMLGLKNVRTDAEGNVIGEYEGKGEKPHLVLSAHLDTVFPKGTDVSVSREGNVLKGPGISDDSRGLAVILAVARVLQKFSVQTSGSISFVATVGEEGLGNLRGVRELFSQTLKNVDYFISVDDVALKTIATAVGSHRYKVTYRGTGGHSYSDFGLANPMHALGRAMAKIADFQVPEKPKTTFSIGRVSGGTSVNSIAHTVWMEVDMRSQDVHELKKLDAAFQKAVREALKEENDRRTTGDSLRLEIVSIGLRPTGTLAADASLLQAVRRADRFLGIEAESLAGSTDANIPISMGIEALTMGGGGDGQNKHSLEETFITDNSHQGTQRVLLTVLELVGFVGHSSVK